MAMLQSEDLMKAAMAQINKQKATFSKLWDLCHHNKKNFNSEWDISYFIKNNLNTNLESTTNLFTFLILFRWHQ